MIINQKWRRSFQDVRARRGADVGSDHVLIVASLSLHRRKAKRGEERQRRFDTVKLKNTMKVFQLDLQNHFRPLQDEHELTIDSLNQVLMETSKTVLSYRRKQIKD